MRKTLIALGITALLLASIPSALLLTGTIDRTSVYMMLNVMAGVSGPQADSATVQQHYQVPEGFSVSLYAKDLPKARFLRFTSAGDLLVSRPHSGDILLLRRDANQDGNPDAIETLIDGLKRPLGIDISGQWLYIAESDRVARIAFNSGDGTVSGELVPIIEGLTDNGNHWSKTIRIGTDERLYLAQGSTCNVCEEQDSRRATLMHFALDGSDAKTFATGLRNSVGFDWAPWSGALYATENGRDLLGDDFPPCELNLIEEGNFYGWPYYNGDNLTDPDMGDDPLTAQRQPVTPAHGFKAHNAPLGMTFLNAATMPEQYQRSALVAFHGSWNRSTPDGYKVVSLHFDGNGIVEKDFLTGFYRDGDISGRPVDVAQGPDGAIYVTDDYAGAIYRIHYGDKPGVANIPLEIAPSSQLDTTPPQWLSSADLPIMAERGRALYQHFGCRSCHEDGTNPKGLEGLAERLGYSAVIDTLEAPQSPMPIYPMSLEQRRELAVYLLHTAARQPITTQ